MWYELMLLITLMIRTYEGKQLQSFLQFRWRKMDENFSWYFSFKSEYFSIGVFKLIANGLSLCLRDKYKKIKISKKARLKNRALNLKIGISFLFFLYSKRVIPYVRIIRCIV